MRRNWTIEELRELTPEATDEQLAQALEMLKNRKGTLQKTWESENAIGAKPQPEGPDGLSVPERELNRWADENALPKPFQSKRR